MKYSPFYLMPVPENAMDKLFINREEEIEIATRIIAQQMQAIVGVLGGPGVGKSSMLNMISSICARQKVKTKKVVAKEYIPEKILSQKKEAGGLSADEKQDWSVLLIDNVNFFPNDSVIDFYRKVSGEKIIVFFVDTLRRPMKVLQERKQTTTHISIVLPEKLDIETCEKFLRKRLEHFGERYRFTPESISLAAKRSSGNLREFFKYCGAAWALTDNLINKESMIVTIQKVDGEILHALSDKEKEIIQLLHEKSLNITQTVHELTEKRHVKISRSTLETILANLTNLGLLMRKKIGYEVRYSTIYSDLKISLPNL